MLLVALAGACGARSSLYLAESSAGAGGATSSVSSVGGAASVSSGSVTASVSSGGGAGGDDACASVVCNKPPSACHVPKGTCSDGVCSYALADGAACDDGDGCTSKDTCASGVCAGSPVLCDMPPAPTCASTTTLHAWVSPGVCSAGTCGYPIVNVPCPAGCVDGACTGAPIAAKVSAGGYHTCAITSTGAVQCWGGNTVGELGNGSTADSHVPVDVLGLPSAALAVTTGDVHTCALTSSGAVECWGYNSSGQLGDGTTNDSHVPVAVQGLSSGVLTVSAGAAHTCAVTKTGAVECWGSNSVGELGNGTKTDSSVPVQVVGLKSGATAVAANAHHTCALTVTGGVVCWGNNQSGELGDGSTLASDVPVGVVGLSSGVAAVAAGVADSCALTAGGGLKCWGNNFSGQLGNGTTTESHVPVDVPGLTSGVLGVSMGEGACALTFAGTVKCWGPNSFGQLGNGTTSDSYLPVDVQGLSGVLAIDSGDLDACAVTSNGALECWGWNFYGQLGNNSVVNSSVPVAVVGL